MTDKSSRATAVSFFAALCVVWGSTWIVTDTLADHVPVLAVAGLRYLLSAVFCIPFLLRRRTPRPPWLPVLSVALMMLVVPLVVFDWARPRLPAATVMVLFALVPLILVVIKAAPPRAMHASIGAIAGLCLALSVNFTLTEIVPALAVLLAAIASAMASLLAQSLLSRHAPLKLTAYVCGAAGCLLLPLSLGVEGRASWTPQALMTTAGLAMVSGAPAYCVWFWLLARWPAWKVAAVEWVVPLVGLAETAIYFRVPFSWTMGAGTLITVLSLFILLRQPEGETETVSLLRG